ncbi:MAG: hypothetical protein ICV63_14090, partial [Coleofasciculus sp. Co-bin14]|nr:hypothetical protein [Coleofasciculus sp. Co-bin14]
MRSSIALGLADAIALTILLTVIISHSKRNGSKVFAGASAALRYTQPDHISIGDRVEYSYLDLPVVGLIAFYSVYSGSHLSAV